MDTFPSSVRVSETQAQTESVMRLVEISAGYWLPRALQVVADLAIADALDQEPRSAADLPNRSELTLMPWTEYCVCSLRMASSIGAKANTCTARSLVHCAATIRNQCAPMYGLSGCPCSGRAGERLSK
ncbi:MAG: hypothetical protein JWN63_1545 [Candidatus Acidoferrum typicum]|nr:hypothetical protein [Candidatus Acidoferrum typicum]